MNTWLEVAITKVLKGSVAERFKFEDYIKLKCNKYECSDGHWSIHRNFH